MNTMKVEIEVPVVPEGWRVVGVRKPMPGHLWLLDGWQLWPFSDPGRAPHIVAERINPPIVLDPRLVAVLPDGWICKEGCGVWYWSERKPRFCDRTWFDGGRIMSLRAIRQDLFPDVKSEDSLFEIKEVTQ